MADKTRTQVRRSRSIYQVHYSLRKRDDLTKPLFADMEIQEYSSQVAGHQGADGKKYTGLLQCSNGTILKPILKESSRREVEFYERLATTDNKDLLELRNFVPKYFGCKRYSYNGFEQEYIILEDLTYRMLQPCVMDVKIGRRTWDAHATPEKIAKEQSKYALCKQEYAFCIPGYQVYNISTGKLHRYGKDHGKKLHGRAVVDAIRKFLNAGAAGAARALLLPLLAALWRLQRGAATLRLPAASLLLLYDAAALPPRTQKSHPMPRRQTIHCLHSLDHSTFSGQLSPKGPIVKKVNSFPLTNITQHDFSTTPPITSPWSEALDRLKKNHSFEHNYEDKLSKIKMNYRAMLDQLSNDSPTPTHLGIVRVIDFAHASFNEDPSDGILDYNFKEGLDSFVGILEMLLKETDDQVF